jgi:cell division protein FtsI (penicillin-binding protein 3)
VFSQVAQEVLEYLGVPHDQPVKTKKQMQEQIAVQRDVPADGPSESGADIGALYAEINNLPADDPLRAAGNAAAAGESTSSAARAPEKSSKARSGGMDVLPAKVAAALRESQEGSPAVMETAAIASPKIVPVVQKNGAVRVDSGTKVAVPEFAGAGLRSVIEGADAAGLRVEPVGSGLAREQVPAAGTMVPAGTEVVVKFSR